MATDIYVNIPANSGGGSGVSSLNSLTGALTLVAGSNITITPSGTTLTIASTGGGGGSGTVTSFTFTNGGGFTGTVLTSTTTPTLSLVGTLTGDITGSLTSTTLTATSNSTLTTLSSLSLPYSQVTGTPTPIVFSDSLVNTSGTVTLKNDSATPGASKYYGTNASSVLGYYTFASSENAINQLTGDVVAGPAVGSQSVPATIAAIQGTTVSGTTGTGNVVFSNSPTFTGTITGNISGTASNITTGTFTQGSVLFANSSGQISQDNSNFYWNDINFSLGLSTNTPASNTFIDGVQSTGAAKRLQLTGYGTGSFVGYRGRFARGTSGSPTAAQTGDILNFISGQGYGASQFPTASTGAANFIAGENFTNTSNFTYFTVNTTPTGAVTSTEAFRVATTGVTLGPQSSSTAIHQVNGGSSGTTRTITGNLTVDTTTTDYIIFCNNTAGITITLPSPTIGRMIVIKDINGNSGTNNITIAPHASESIEGLAASYIFQTNYGCIELISDGTNWWIC